MQPLQKSTLRVPKQPIITLTVPLYQGVIDDTIARSKPDFVQEGVDETILEELRRLWEDNLVSTGVVGELADSLGHLAGTPASAQQQQQQHQVQQQVQLQQQLPLAYRYHTPALPPLPGLPAQLPGLQTQYPRTVSAPTTAMPSAASPLFMVAPASAAALMAAAAAQRKRQLDADSAAQGLPPPKHPQAPPPYGNIPQQDGPADDDETAGPGTVAATVEASAAGTSAAAAADAGLGGGGDDVDELGEDDDLEEADAEEVDEEGIGNVVRGAFEKVQRSKGKWKVTAKNCVATINGRDYLLKKVTGEMQFQ